MSAIQRHTGTECARIGAQSHRLAMLARRAQAAIRRRFRMLRLDSRTRYLAQAIDHPDLERRMRAYDEPTRRCDALWFWL
jgi:hypothetical protein